MDSILNLAFLMHKSPRVYALLLGAGMSQSMGIPTAWDITQGLIHQIEVMTGEEYKGSRSYSALLRELGKTQAERNAILREYFEPTEEQEVSPAYEAIAELIKAGYIQVVLTTNFDRALESALNSIGVVHDVISSDDMLKGATPIRHSKITIVKLHGDYRDARSLNTENELEKYSSYKNILLETIFDEYGLIVCGWSAKWDPALRDAVYCSVSRRYSMFWVEPYPLSQEATDLIGHCKAEVIEKSADEFFSELQNNVQTLAKLNAEHPLTVAVAVERVKKLLPYPHTQIELEDLLRNEAEHAYKRFESNFVWLPPKGNYDVIQFYDDKILEAFKIMEVFLNMVATLCLYGKGEQQYALTDIVKGWASSENLHKEYEAWRGLPPLLLIYTGGFASLYKSNWQYFRALVRDPKVKSIKSGIVPIFSRIDKSKIFDHSDEYLNAPSDPISLLLNKSLRMMFKNYIRLDSEFDDYFDLFEMVLSIIDLSNEKDSVRINHNAVMKNYIRTHNLDHIREFWIKGAKQRSKWGFIEQLFDGNSSRFVNFLREYCDICRKTGINIPDYYSDYLSAEPIPISFSKPFET